MTNKIYQNMDLMTFQAKYQNEENCREQLFKMRWPDGFRCPRCNHNKYYLLRNRHLYQCRECRHQTSVTAGTVLHKTRSPLLKWFWTIYLMSNDKRGISALSLHKKLGISYFKAWTMEHKIRTAMGDRDARYMLAGLVDVDESYFGGRQEGDKRGRGTSKQPVAIEVATHGKAMGFARLRHLKSVDGVSLLKVIKEDIKPDQVIRTDGLKVYNILEKNGIEHMPVVIGDKKAHEVFKWVHVLASNAKAFLKGTYHGRYTLKHFQRYLDEFCYRLNRRKWEGELFDRLLRACVTSKGITCAELI